MIQIIEIEGTELELATVYDIIIKQFWSTASIRKDENGVVIIKLGAYDE